MKMSEHHIHFHIQEEIMKRLPVKSLVQFRSVSKAWKSLIDSSEFIAAHSLHSHSHQQHLLVSYGDLTEMADYVLSCRSYIDDATFPQQNSTLTLPPFPSQQNIRLTVVGSSRGLVCLCGFDPDINTDITILWNPSIRKSFVVAAPVISYGFGFGICPVTNDPKMVSITQTSHRCEVMVYTLSSGKWRNLSTNLPTMRLMDWCFVVVTDRFIYWRAKLTNRYMIMSFDVTNESFEAIDLPDSLARHDYRGLHISKIRESLAMLQNKENICTVWMMEHGVQRSFTKLFTLEAPHEIVGFRLSGVPIMQVTDEDDVQYKKLVVYEPNSEHNNVIGISGSPFPFDVTSYMETLLLLGRSGCISY